VRVLSLNRPSLLWLYLPALPRVTHDVTLWNCDSHACAFRIRPVTSQECGTKVNKRSHSSPHLMHWHAIEFKIPKRPRSRAVASHILATLTCSDTVFQALCRCGNDSRISQTCATLLLKTRLRGYDWRKGLCAGTVYPFHPLLSRSEKVFTRCS